MLSAAQREVLARRILRHAIRVGIGAASVREIDRLNIYHASTLAMRRAVRRLSIAPDHVVIDGRAIRTLDIPHTAIVHGDARCFSIACASIIAKVTRDRLMTALARRYDGYRWERNAGYATPDHLSGLTTRGITPHHRRSFFRVSQLSLDLDSTANGILWETGEGPVPAAALEIVLADVALRESVEVGDSAADVRPDRRSIASASDARPS
jgi:ribonuclease HII